MPAGYSQRSLIDKLGIKPESRVSILHAPAGYDATLGGMPAGVKRFSRVTPDLDFIQGFYISRASLERAFPSLKRALKTTGALWISWPKRAAKMQTDVTENLVRDIGLTNGLVDIKICAVDETWSGLKFVYRLTDR